MRNQLTITIPEKAADEAGVKLFNCAEGVFNEHILKIKDRIGRLLETINDPNNQREEVYYTQRLEQNQTIWTRIFGSYNSKE